MRIIDDIPESELVKLFLGNMVDEFKQKSQRAWSPSAGKNIKLTVFEYYAPIMCRGVRVYYSNTAKAIRISLKELFQREVDSPGVYEDEWETIERVDVPVADPNGPHRVQACIRNWLHLPSRGKQVQMHPSAR